jgi:hypothetical protein
MTSKWIAGPLVIVSITVITMTASAQHVRSAKVGDPIASLLTGLVPVNGGGIRGQCLTAGPDIRYIQFLVPPRVDIPVFGLLGNYDDDNASFLGFIVGTHMVMLVAFDEQNPSLAAQVFADLDGNGRITNVWPVAQAPALCAIVQQLHYKP